MSKWQSEVSTHSYRSYSNHDNLIILAVQEQYLDKWREYRLPAVPIVTHACIRRNYGEFITDLLLSLLAASSSRSTTGTSERNMLSDKIEEKKLLERSRIFSFHVLTVLSWIFWSVLGTCMQIKERKKSQNLQQGEGSNRTNRGQRPSQQDTISDQIKVIYKS